MPTRLTGMDAIWLNIETRAAHMHVGGAIVLDPSTTRKGGLTREGLTGYLAERLHLAAPLRRRLSTVPCNLDFPAWIEDPDFDLDRHVRAAVLPAPGGLTELGEFAAEVMSRPLDRTRPLWELWFVEGLEGGRVGLVTKTHHAAVDGVSGAQLTAAIMQTAPDQRPLPPSAPWSPEREPSELDKLVGAGLRLTTTPLRLARTGAQTLQSVAGLLRAGADRRIPPPPAPFSAPVTRLNGAIGPRRRVAFCELSLETIDGVRRSAGDRRQGDVVDRAAGGSPHPVDGLQRELAERHAASGSDGAVEPGDRGGEGRGRRWYAAVGACAQQARDGLQGLCAGAGEAQRRGGQPQTCAHQLVQLARLPLGAPWGARRQRPLIGRGLHDRGGRLRAAHPVDRGVVGLGDQAHSPTLKPLDEPQLPQRPGAVQGPAHDLGRELAELGQSTGGGQDGRADVPIEVEVRVLDPGGEVQVARHRGQPPSQRCRKVEALGQVPGQPLAGEPALPRRGGVQYDRAADVHVRGARLDVQPDGIHPGETCGHAADPRLVFARLSPCPRRPERCRQTG